MKRTMKKTASKKTDIVAAILEDHKPLKAMIKIMKGEKVTFAKKKETFEKFAPTLIAHAKPEEQTWYVSLKQQHDMSVEGIEGDVEHGLADQLCDELKSERDEDTFMAKVKVLAELVEHHIEEEEEDLLPEYKKNSDPQERQELAEQYFEIQSTYISGDNVDKSSAELAA